MKKAKSVVNGETILRTRVERVAMIAGEICVSERSGAVVRVEAVAEVLCFESLIASTLSTRT
jgi:hypothetical protein